MATAGKTVKPAQGESTRHRILHAAMNRASREGLESLSIGDLAKELSMSKSGLFAHFGSKEELQIATIGAAEHVFGSAIVDPACRVPEGIARLKAYVDSFVRYLENSVFPGGCFFAAVAAEYDDRPGRVRDRIGVSMRKWKDLLREQAGIAHTLGELRPEVDPDQLVFELKAFTHEANLNRRMLDDPMALRQAARAIAARLESVASRSGRAHLKS